MKHRVAKVGWEETCPMCGGEGEDWEGNACELCEGSGYTQVGPILVFPDESSYTTFKDMTEIFEEWLKEFGGCDHDVGICCCHEDALLDDAKQIIKAVEEAKACGKMIEIDL